jgi:hypothetical protein
MLDKLIMLAERVYKLDKELGLEMGQLLQAHGEELKKQHNAFVNMFQDNQAMLAKIEELTKKGKKK